MSNVVRKTLRTRDCLLAGLKSYDAVVVERELFDDPSDFHEKLLGKGTSRLVLDIDDGVFLRYPDKFARLCGYADHVIAGNSLLQAYCEKYNASTCLIPTSVDLQQYPVAPVHAQAEIPVIGWVGTPGNIPYLAAALPAIKQAAKTRRLLLKVISSTDEELEKLDTSGLNVQFAKWNAETAEREIAQFSIGIMPLPNEEWERYKCGFKLIQYMAAHVPAIASPVGANREIVAHGVDGLLAGDATQWQQCLERYLASREYCQTVAEAARAKVERQYSIAANAPAFAKAVFGPHI